MSDPRGPGPDVYQRTSEVLESEIGDELVALDVATGDCFAFNEVAKTVWSALSEPKSLDQLQTQLLSDYDVSPAQCATQLAALLEDLTELGLITKS